MSVSSPPILKILSDLDIDLMDVNNDVDYLRALMEATNALVITNASDKRIPILQREIKRVRAGRKKADPKFKQKVKKTTVSPKKIMGQKMLPAAKMDAKKLASKSGGGGSDALTQILVSVTSIRDILINQIKDKRDDAKNKRRATQNANRKEKESGLEVLKKGFSSVKSGVEKVVAPVKNLFKEVLDFIGKIVLGRIVFKLLEWFSDKKNQDKVKAIGKFLKKTWPVLLAGFLLFGNSFGRMAVKLGVMIAKFSVRLVTKIIPALIKAIAKMKMGKLLKRIPGLSAGGLLPQMSEGGMIEGPQSGYPVSLDGGKSTAFEGHGTEEVRTKGNDSFVIPIDTPDTKKNPFLTEQRTDEANKLGFSPSQQGMDFLSNADPNKEMTQEDLVALAGPSLMQFMEHNNSMIDSDPDAIFGEHMRMEMDRDGKMINFGKTIANMSEWAFNSGVEQLQNNEAIDPDVKEALLKKMAWIRKETLENPNFKADMAFDINKDIPGTAANRLFLKAQADTTSITAKAGISARDRALLWNRRGMSRGGLLKGYSRGGLHLLGPAEGFGKGKAGSKKFSGSQLKGLLDSQKGIGKTIPKPTQINRSINRPKVSTIGTPVKKSVVQAYNEQAESKIIAVGGGGNTTSQSGGKNDLPDFDAAAKRSLPKIKTLGISV